MLMKWDDRNKELVLANGNLQDLTVEIATKIFRRVYRGSIKFNPRLRSTGGRCVVESGFPIEINPIVATNDEALVDVIKHELCHYYCMVDGDSGNHNSPKFKEMILIHGGNKELNFADLKPELLGRKIIVNGRVANYLCPKCGYRTVLSAGTKLQCSQCHEQYLIQV